MGSFDYLSNNQDNWTKAAPEYAEAGRKNWQGEPHWGLWHVSEEDVGLLPDVQGLDTLEVGCGTAYLSSWLHRRGARPVGIDPTRAQLDTARGLQEEFDMPFPDESFDLVISEYGASIWSDPYLWIPEATRVLRPGGQLIFLVNGTIMMLCAPDDDGPVGTTLLRDYFGLHRFEWPNDEGIEFHLGYGDWIRLLRTNGYEIEDLIEIRPPEGATTRYDFVTLEWSRRWPCEEVWKARKK
jgi:SAM-dependent methyltransferase